MILLIIGSGPTWKDDLLKALNLVDDFHVCVINHQINNVFCELLQEPEYWYSYHPDILRVKYPEYDHIQIHSVRNLKTKNVVVHEWQESDWVGSSSLQAVKIAISRWKYKKIILVGVPLSGIYNDLFYQRWVEAKKFLFGKVKSCSGKTKLLLGEPTKDWVQNR